jgi:ERCC4-type nuclease
MTFLVSPTEPDAVRGLGQRSSLPERHGCDVLWTDPRNGLVGVQRKTLADLWTSLRDGRLARELLAMRSTLEVAVLLIEGRLRWSATGRLATAEVPLDRAQLRGLLLSVQRQGLWVVHTDDVLDTCSAVRGLRAWLGKPHHVSLDVRPSARASPGTRGWGLHLLQSFPRIGPVCAASLWDHFGGVPLAWTCDERALAGAPGVGPARASDLWRSLPPLPSVPDLLALAEDEVA